MNLRPSLRRAAVVAALATITCPLAACGAGNTESWVGTFCGAGSGLRTVLSDANAKLTAQLAANESPGAIKLSVVADANRIAAAATDAKARISDAGEPSVDQGRGIQETAVRLYDSFASQANQLPSLASSISGTDAASLTEGIGLYSRQVADLSRRVAGSFNVLQGTDGYGELEKVSRTPDPETHIDETCAKLQAPAS